MLSRWDAYLDVLKLTEDQLNELMRQRAGTGKKDPGESSREHCRVRMRGALWFPAEIREPAGGTSQRIKVYPVDISAGGMCFLAGRFVHEKTECDLIIHFPDGESLTLTGKTVRCKHMQGRAHEVGVNFDKPFEMSLLQAIVPATSVPGGAAPERAATPATATGPETVATLQADLEAITREINSLTERLAGATAAAERLRAAVSQPPTK